MSSYQRPNTMSYPEGAGVLITGCSTGIGRAVALYLADRGFLVFATVRKETDAANLRGLNQPNLIPICPLDLRTWSRSPRWWRRSAMSFGGGASPVCTR